MVSHRSKMVLLWGLAFLGLSGGALLPAPWAAEESAARLEQKIRRQLEPIKKVRLQIKLARIHLNNSAKAYRELDFDGGKKLLNTYLDSIREARRILDRSGRDPQRQPRGYKDLEIALRQDLRILTDLKRSVPYFAREAVQARIDQVDEMREEVLQSMFDVSGTNRENRSTPGGRPTKIPLAHRPVLVSASYSPLAPQQDPAGLSEAEVELVRGAQDPGDRIIVFVQIAGARLDKFEEFQKETGRRNPGKGYYLDSMLEKYIAVYDEMKDWIEYQYDKGRDMRRGLRRLLKDGPVQLERLSRAQEHQDEYSIDYAENVQYAMETLQDTLEGGTVAFREQEEEFRAKEEEEKARKKQEKQKKKQRR
ncbi:MAG: hypothetical protein O6850_08060 [Acidobacteria bacterium]|nr:hypothetical protein [Acidobacteriota bacterium]